MGDQWLLFCECAFCNAPHHPNFRKLFFVLFGFKYLKHFPRIHSLIAISYSQYFLGFFQFNIFTFEKSLCFPRPTLWTWELCCFSKRFANSGILSIGTQAVTPQTSFKISQIFLMALRSFFERVDQVIPRFSKLWANAFWINEILWRRSRKLKR